MKVKECQTVKLTRLDLVAKDNCAWRPLLLQHSKQCICLALETALLCDLIAATTIHKLLRDAWRRAVQAWAQRSHQSRKRLHVGQLECQEARAT